MSLSFKTWSGVPFQQPQLTSRGIVAHEYCHNADGRVEMTDYTFSSRGRKQIILDNGDIRYVYPVDPFTLAEFLKLPAINVDERVAAMKLWGTYTLTIPYACYDMLALKGSTEPDTTKVGMYRVPVKKVQRTEVKYRQVPVSVDIIRPVKRTTTVKRQPTMHESLAIMLGHKVSLETTTEQWYDEPKTIHLPPRDEQYEERVNVTVPNEELTKYQQFFRRPAYSQQLIGVRTIMKAKRLGLFYDMRVGKTDTAEAAMKCALSGGEIDFFVVVCPKTNMYDPWYPVLRAAGYHVAIIDGTEEEDIDLINERRFDRTAAINAPTVYVINYERLALRQTAIQKAWDLSRIGVIGDETSAIKNPTATRSRAMHWLCASPPYVVLLNGTPMEQGPHDLYSQLKCLDPHGIMIGPSFGAFCDKFLMSVGPGKWRVSTEPSVRMAFDWLISSTSIRYIRSEADQFAGKDKNFRYIKIRPTAQMRRQARNVLDGFVRTLSEKGERKEQSLSDLLIVTYGFLREVSCGYDKYRDDDDSEYIRVRHTFDPKLLWVLCHLESCPSDPLVVYCEFNEQEQRLKEELNARGIPWSSTAPECQVLNKLKFLPYMSTEVLTALQAKFPTRDWMAVPIEPYGVGKVWTPEVVMYDEELCRYAQNTLWRQDSTEWYKVYRRKSYTPQERAREIAKFNTGETQVFICKTSQARGIRLNREEALADKIGVPPTMVSLAPPWSLGTWDQALDRCVGVDQEAKKNVCTTIYCLACPGMESTILKALRAKKDVQAELLKDAEREGYASFVESLVTDMEGSGADGTEDDFDPEEMFARMTCGVPPGSKLKESLIFGKLLEKPVAKTFNWKSRKDVQAWVSDPANLEHEVAKAAIFLQGLCE